MPFPSIQARSSVSSAVRRLALIGNPNCGKTTLFNALTGLRARTGNYPGTTVERREGRMVLADELVEVIDLPGLYDFHANTDDERVALAVIEGRAAGTERLDGVIVVLDAAHLSRSLFLASQIMERKLPVVAVLTMVDVAESNGVYVHPTQLELELGCPIIPVLARTGRGLPALRQALRQMNGAPPTVDTISVCGTCGGCRFQSRYAWTDAVAARCTQQEAAPPKIWTERVDRILTHPVLGVGVFMAVMLGVFFLIFKVASVPMDLIDAFFSGLGSWINTELPEGTGRDLLVQGIIGGVGGVLVFLPQICILFFCLALLEDTGYLARAAFVMDRLMQRVGLPGRAFVPLLSAHACAIPAIMATRVIADKRDRLVTILIAPLLSCSARIPVYSMLAALLFANEPGKAALVFTGAYVLGLTVALLMALVFKKTVLPGEPNPLLMELPAFKMPSLRTALLTVLDRVLVFVRKAGTVILLISVALWALATYPKSAPPPEAGILLEQARVASSRGDADAAHQLEARANHLISHHALAESAAGRLGRFIEPVLRPLGFDWQIGIGIISSFAAREVVVSTLAVVYGIGEEAASDDPQSLYDSLRRATRSDGSKVFTLATCMSLLVFYVLAMQCLPTQAVTRRETNSWKWPFLQLAYMTALAYTAALIVFQGLRALGVS
jgi:ferrous iron transport protein B